MNQELISKAKETKSAEELLALAKENGVEMTEESAKSYFDQLHPKTGELSDEELDNVAGGSCYSKDGRLVVSAVTVGCGRFRCKKDGGSMHHSRRTNPFCGNCYVSANCGHCKYCSYEKGLWLCSHPEGRQE